MEQLSSALCSNVINSARGFWVPACPNTVYSICKGTFQQCIHQWQIVSVLQSIICYSLALSSCQIYSAVDTLLDETGLAKAMF